MKTISMALRTLMAGLLLCASPIIAHAKMLLHDGVNELRLSIGDAEPNTLISIDEHAGGDHERSGTYAYESPVGFIVINHKVIYDKHGNFGDRSLSVENLAAGSHVEMIEKISTALREFTSKNLGSNDQFQMAQDRFMTTMTDIYRTAKSKNPRLLAHYRVKSHKTLVDTKTASVRATIIGDVINIGSLDDLRRIQEFMESARASGRSVSFHSE